MEEDKPEPILKKLEIPDKYIQDNNEITNENIDQII